MGVESVLETGVESVLETGVESVSEKEKKWKSVEFFCHLGYTFYLQSWEPELGNFCQKKQAGDNFGTNLNLGVKCVWTMDIRAEVHCSFITKTVQEDSQVTPQGDHR